MAKPAPSLLDYQQVLQGSFDEANGRLRTDAVLQMDSGALEVAIDQDSDSIRLGDGVNLITATQEAGKTGLDVNILNSDFEFSPSGLRTGLKSSKFIVTTTPQQVPAVALANRNGISIRNFTPNSECFVGGEDVTVENGYPKYYREEIVMDVTDNPDVAVWVVCAIGTIELRIMEVA